MYGHCHRVMGELRIEDSIPLQLGMNGSSDVLPGSLLKIQVSSLPIPSDNWPLVTGTQRLQSFIPQY